MIGRDALRRLRRLEGNAGISALQRITRHPLYRRALAQPLVAGAGPLLGEADFELMPQELVEKCGTVGAGGVGGDRIPRRLHRIVEASSRRSGRRVGKPLLHTRVRTVESLRDGLMQPL